MSSFRKMIAIAMLAMAWEGCSCDALIAPPDGGMGGGRAGGSGTAGGAGTAGGTGTAGGMAGGNTAGGAAGGAAGGSAGGMAGGNTAGGAAGGSAGGGPIQFTEYVRDLIVTGTSGTAQPRPESEWGTLPDNVPIAFSPGFFDGGTN